KVTLKIIDENGCTKDTVVPDYITVGGKLDVRFTTAYTTKCDSTPVSFSNQSLDLISAWASRPGRLKSFTWNFGDGTSYTGYSIKSSYNFDDPNSGPENTYPKLSQDSIVWVKDHSFSDCSVYRPTVTVTVYQPNGTTIICSKSKRVYVKVWAPHANIQAPAKG